VAKALINKTWWSSCAITCTTHPPPYGVAPSSGLDTSPPLPPCPTPHPPAPPGCFHTSGGQLPIPRPGQLPYTRLQHDYQVESMPRGVLKRLGSSTEVRKRQPPRGPTTNTANPVSQGSHSRTINTMALPNTMAPHGKTPLPEPSKHMTLRLANLWSLHTHMHVCFIFPALRFSECQNLTYVVRRSVSTCVCTEDAQHAQRRLHAICSDLLCIPLDQRVHPSTQSRHLPRAQSSSSGIKEKT